MTMAETGARQENISWTSWLYVILGYVFYKLYQLDREMVACIGQLGAFCSLIKNIRIFIHVPSSETVSDVGRDLKKKMEDFTRFGDS